MSWLKLTLRPHFLFVESVLDIVSLNFFDHFNHRLDVLVLVNHIHDKIDMIPEFDEERDTIDKHEFSG